MSMDEIRQAVEALVQERFNNMADSLDSQAYYLRDHGGTVEREIANVYDEIAKVLREGGVE